MKNHNRNRTVLCTIIAGVAICASGDTGDTEPRRADAASDASPPQVAYAGCVRIFNGRDFDGWVADPSTWSITNGAMRGIIRVMATTAEDVYFVE